MRKPGPNNLAKDVENLRARVNKNLKSSRERSIALTKLEEGQMWLAKAIEFDKQKKEQ